MPKAEKGTPKDIANRIKSRGLQKLKFYCQMCEKQCRDANGFKCHLTSEAHMRQMKIFSDNAGGILDQYSKDFERLFIATLRMRHGIKKVNANNVYQEVISDKQHIHMNATHWTTLSDFVQYLGKTGKCVVEETERGWFVSYIERDVSILARNEARQRREVAEKAAEEAQAQRMELQRIEAAKALDRAGGTVHTEATKMERTEDDQPIKVALTSNNTAKKASKVNAPPVFGAEEEDDEEEEPVAPKLEPPIMPVRREKPATVEPRQRQKRKEKRSEDHQDTKRAKREEHDRTDYWLYRNIIVRIIAKKLGDGQYFKRKAIVDKVIDKYTAQIEVLDSSTETRDGGDIVRLDQDDLETVIPKELDKKVRILNGRYRGEKATVKALDKKRCQGTLKLSHDGQILKNVPYEDFSKIA